MHRAVTAIYRTEGVAHLVRDELERLGIARRHITVLGGDRQGGGMTDPEDLRGGAAAGGTPGGAYMGVLPGAGMGMTAGGAAALPAYRDEDLAYSDDFDTLHDLHLPEADTRTYQQALRNGDYVVSVEVDEDADIARIQEIMRRPEEAYDLNALETNYRDADYAPRRRPHREDYQEGMLGRRAEMQDSPTTRDYVRDEPLWPRGGAA